MAKTRELELIGQRIAAVREMTREESEAQGWGRVRGAKVIVLENGIKIFASRDEEGNDVGCLFGETEDGGAFYL